jgi:nucleoside-diphosphate-sugar epimerase
VGRSREKLDRLFGSLEGAEPCVADLATAEGAKAASKGVDTIVYCVGIPYETAAFAQLPKQMGLVLDAAVAEGVRRVLLVTNIYPYGRPTTPTIAESHPRQPCSKKGEYRKAEEDVLLERQRAGKLGACVVRLPDFYGPGSERMVIRNVFDEALAGKTANLIGPVDTPHEFVFVDDVGPVLADLLARDDVWSGEVFHLGGAGTITVREFATQVFKEVGKPPRFRVAGPLMVRLLGIFMPVMRELVEMLYLQATPLILDDSKLRAKLGNVVKTPYSEGIRRTVQALQRK